MAATRRDDEGYSEFDNAVKIARMEERLKNIEEDIAAIKKAVDELTSASARVKGGIIVVLMIGGFLGGLAQIFGSVFKIWPFH